MKAAPTFVDLFYRSSGAEQWGVSRIEFRGLIASSARHHFGAAEPPPAEVERYIATLNLADLALAGGCALGHDAAWDHFVLEHRPLLYRAADALDPTGGARDLADALYADLYGIREGSEERRSLFRYFHGRSSLSTWLRAVLSQRYVDRLRAGRRLESLPHNHEALPAPTPPVADPDRVTLVPLVFEALRAAILVLSPRDRLRLRSYHGAGMTLAEIGRLTGEHEATVSRHLTKTRRTLRDVVDRSLRERSLTATQIARALELALEDPEDLDLRTLMGGERKDPAQDRSS